MFNKKNILQSFTRILVSFDSVLDPKLKIEKHASEVAPEKKKSCRKSSKTTQHPGPDMVLKSFQRDGQDRKSPTLTMTRI